MQRDFLCAGGERAERFQREAEQQLASAVLLQLLCSSSQLQPSRAQTKDPYCLEPVQCKMAVTTAVSALRPASVTVRAARRDSALLGPTS